MVARAIDLLTRNYTSNMVARSKNKRWIVSSAVDCHASLIHKLIPRNYSAGPMTNRE